MWIYKITNRANGKVYVGKTCDLRYRWYCHRAGRHVGAIAKAFKKYGVDNFEFSILEEDIEDEMELNRLEMYWIEKLESHGRKGGYNMTLGGDGTRFTEEMRARRSGKNASMYGKKHTPEARAKMSAQRKGRPQTPAQRAASAKLHISMKGRWFSEEHRAKIATAKRGSRHSPETLAKLRKPKSQEHRSKLREACRRRPGARIVEYGGERLNVIDWAAKIGMSKEGLKARLDNGWSVERALTTPVGRWKSSRDRQMVLIL